jgi:ribosomal protein S18 acetylase RimI-like enzyme
MAADPDFALWIAESGRRAVGYAEAGRCLIPHPDVTATCGELQRLYVRAEAQGGGLGVRLLETALGWLERPRRRLWIGVWSQNHGAQRLYARYGFTKVGEYEFHVGRTRDREFILARPGF